MSVQDEMSRHSSPQKRHKRETHGHSALGDRKLEWPPKSQKRSANGSSSTAILPEMLSSNAMKTQLLPPAASSHLKSVSSASTRQHRGRDWESWKQDESDGLSKDVNVPWRRSHGRTVTPSAIRRLEAKSGAKVTRPLSSTLHSSSNSQVSESISHDSFTRETKALAGSAFEYAIHPSPVDDPHLEHQIKSPLPTDEDTTSESTSPPLSLLDQNELLYGFSDEKEPNMTSNGIPAFLKAKDSLTTHTCHILLRTLLMRCQTIQSTIHQVESKSWAQEAQRQLYHNYSKMRRCAYKAKRLAEALDSCELQARCEYWAGRGCGGARDFPAAADHFALATKLDVQNDTYPSGRIRMRGLRLHEKEDVHFLLKSATEKWTRYTAQARDAARYEARHTKRSIGDCIDWSEVERLSWTPNRDFVVYMARRQYGTKKPLGTRAESLDALDGEENSMKKEEQSEQEDKTDGTYPRHQTRRKLSPEEWRYIHHGDTRTEKRQDSPKLIRPVGKPNPSAKSVNQAYTFTKPESISTEPSNTSSPETTVNLRDELAQAGWVSRTPTPPAMTRRPSPSTNLKQRRNITIPPIRTGGTPKQERGGCAGSAPLLQRGSLWSSKARRVVGRVNRHVAGSID